MDVEQIQTAYQACVAGGIVLTTTGGLGMWFFGRQEKKKLQLELAAAREKINALQKSCTELQQQIDAQAEMEIERGEVIEPVFEVIAAEPAPKPVDVSLPRPTPAMVKIPASSWAGASVLDSLIEAEEEPHLPTPAASSALAKPQRATMVSILRKHAGRGMTIRALEGDNAGLDFARELKAVFEEAGWNVPVVESFAYANPPAGLFITAGAFASPEETIIPHEALAAAGCEVSRCADSNLKSENAVLLVGTAPWMAATAGFAARA